MKTVNSGIIRRIDDLGRVVIPKEMRKMADIKVGDPLEVGIANGCIIFEKYTGETDEETGKPKPQNNDGSPVRAVKVAEPKKITLYVDTVNGKAYKTIEEIIPTMLDNGDIDSMDEWLCQNYTASSIHEMIVEQGFDNYKQVIDEDYADYCHGCALELIECYRYTDYVQAEVEI